MFSLNYLKRWAATCLIIASLSSTNLWAHGGVAVEIDTCRIPVGDAWVHFTGYTPTFTADTEYCKEVPNVGYTNLVFDYEDPKLKKMSVEFEITKEPDGTRVYYQEPKQQLTGTINAVIDFSKDGLGESDYLAHVTLVNEGKKIDAHLPFNVNSGGYSGGSNTSLALIMVVLSALAVGAYFYSKKQNAL